jgi:hypothetical protein
LFGKDARILIIDGSSIRYKAAAGVVRDSNGYVSFTSDWNRTGCDGFTEKP